MALSVTVLRFAMSLSFPPREVLTRANTSIVSDQQSRMFATVFLGYLDLDFGILEYASAGHNPPLLYRADSGSCEYLAASGVAIGLFEEAEYIGNKAALRPGDVLVLYTDGITELIDAHEEEFGEERLKELVLQNISLAAQDLTELIIDTARDFAGDEGAVDDQTIVVIRCLREAT